MKHILSAFILCLLCSAASYAIAETSITPFTEERFLLKKADSNDSNNDIPGIVTARWLLNVRISPWGTIIDGFKPGRSVSIVAREGSWYRIRYGSGYAYVHTSLVDASGNPAATTAPVTPNPPAPPANSSPAAGQNSTDDINGPGIPSAMLSGLEAAKQSEWFKSGKCLQFAGTIAAKAGATPGRADASQPQSAYPADNTLRGYQINDLSKAVDAGLLKPGMLIHVKIHYDKDPAYHVSNDAHHWFIYMGRNSDGVPMFADNTHKGNLQTADEVYSNMKGWKNSKNYGDEKYGYVPRVTSIHDPFADRR